MVQILRANPQKTFGQALGEGVGVAIKGASELYQQHQKKTRYNEALKGVEDIYADPKLSQEQKFVRAFSAMREFPEVAKQFGEGLSKFSENPYQKAQREKLEFELNQEKGEEDYLSRLMNQGQKKNSGQYRELEPKVSPQDLTEEMGEGQVPQKRKQMEFDYEDPETWTDKQVNEFRSVEGRTPKAKTLSKRAQNEFDRRQEERKVTKKYQEDIAPFQGALETLEAMEKIGAKGNLGIGTTARGFISPQTRKDAAQYERLGKSLISFASNIPIRNRQEFETLAHDLYDPSISDDARSGILEAMKMIIENSMKSFSAPGEEESFQPNRTTPSRSPAQKEKPPLTSFLR